MAESKVVETQQELLNLSNSQVRHDFLIVSSFIYSLTKQPSKTDAEFNIKYDEYDLLFRAHNNWGRGTQIGSLGLLLAYCIKGYNKPMKLLGGFLYVQWQQHLYTLGSYMGLVLYLPGSLKRLNMGEQYETGRYTQQFIKKISDRQEQESRGEKIMPDRQVLNEFYESFIGEQEAKKIKERSYVQNDFFKKNKDQFTKTSDDDKTSHHIFDGQYQYYEDELKLPVLDCFFTRYVYHSFKRWGTRVGQKFGIIDEYK